ncbi:MAG TPA: cyclic pyranopterin monophosphate synthase MoaC [Acidimicrobiia bacterium]|nr:cyclic pyranopterin monophosphate synthase MoaC [Acidimicrobiia bacterium]
MSSEIKLPHLTPAGEAHMVDVSTKEITQRSASAEAIVALANSTADALFGGTLPKGDALATIRVAGIMAAKRTAELIPLCHPLPIDAVEVAIDRVEEGARIVADVTTTARTGVEMEAMTAASVAALALYDMVKGVERGVEIRSLRLLRKAGGRSGTWER